MVFMSLKASRRFPQGFDDAADAHRAGARAANALAQWYRTRWRSQPIGWEGSVPAEEGISIDDVVVGRVGVDDPMGVLGERRCGIQLRIPQETWIAVMLELAQQMYVAMNAVELAS